MSIVHTLETTTHGRYLVQAPQAPGPHPLIVGFHGYGENAAMHLDALTRTVADRDWIIVSVQALARFYTRGDRDVVACWMTREDRELTIRDNVDYVRRTLDVIGDEHAAGRPLVYAGFSQGAAMAYRAAALAGQADAILVLAGDVPPDVVAVAAGLPRTFIGRGTLDEWYTADKQHADVATLSAAGVHVSTHVFDGGHAWTDDFAAAAGKFLDELTG